MRGEILESDPSDISDEEADRIARDELEAELTENARSEVDKDRDFCVKRGFDKPISYADLLEADLSVDFLVDRCLVKGQPCTISGASKGMKTTLSIHLALCLASGEPFLGKFQVNECCRVLFASAESGAPTIRRNVQGMARMMGIDDELLAESIFFQWWVPKTDSESLVNHFIAGIEENNATACVMDPMYLMLNGESHSNLSIHGEQIMTLMNRIIDVGCTPICDDHVKRSSQNAKDYSPLELSDITGAGKSEAFRQWMLLGRRSRFENDDDSLDHNHDLWATIGGSAGFSATWGLDITESFDPTYCDVEYSIELRKGAEVRADMTSTRKDAAAEREAKKQEQKERTLESQCSRVLAAMKREPDRLFVSKDVRAILNCSGDKANAVIYRLESTERISKHPEQVKRGTNKCDAWQYPGPPNLDLGEPQNDPPHGGGQEWEG